jgi:hypothetical protein
MNDFLEPTKSQLHELSEQDIAAISGGDGSEVDSGYEIDARRAVRIDRAYRK